MGEGLWTWTKGTPSIVLSMYNVEAANDAGGVVSGSWPSWMVVLDKLDSADDEVMKD